MIEQRGLAKTTAVYQLRVVLADVSPLIWRRLLIPAQASIAQLHAITQLAFGWDDDHLHRFLIHGGEYGISYDGGISFDDNPQQVHLSRFGLRPAERFIYEYDFTAGWRLLLRVEAILSSVRTHPACTGGARAGPPPECVGPWEYLEFRQRHNIVEAAALLGEILDNPDCPLRRWGEDLASMHTWLNLDRFDRRALNQALAAHATQMSLV